MEVEWNGADTNPFSVTKQTAPKLNFKALTNTYIYQYT